MKNQKKASKYKRTLSSNEKIYVVANELGPPFTIQMVLEGKGSIDKTKLQEAVNIASEANPGSRLILKGFLQFSKWVDSGISPVVREIESNSWDGKSQENMPDILQKMNVKKGPTCEIIILRGSTERIIFRTFHGVMDAKGTITWVEDIFRVLRGEVPLGSLSTITDYEMTKTIGSKEYRKSFSRKCCSPTGNKMNIEDGYIWERKTIKGQFSAIIAKLAVILSDESRKYGAKSARFMIPVDLRLHNKKIRTTGNLSNPIYLEVQENSDWKDVYKTILKSFAEKKEAIIGRFDFIVRYTPLWLLKISFRFVVFRQKHSDRFGLTGIISHAGNFDKDIFSIDGFSPKSVFFIPVQPPTVPMFIGIMGNDSNTEIMISALKKFGNHNRLLGLINRIESELK